MKSASETALDAAQYVREGWCRNELEDGHGNVCAMGAINKALHGRSSHVFSSVFARLRNKIARATTTALKEQDENKAWMDKWENGGRRPEGPDSLLVNFNNHYCDSAEQLAQAFEKAAAWLAEHGD